MLGLREILAWILKDYLAAKTAPMKKNPIHSRLADARQELAQLPAVARSASLKIRASFGKGVWATVPWISFLDTRETETTEEGVYVVYLFRSDMKGVYLTLNQGVTGVKKQVGGGQAVRKELAKRAQEFRKIAQPLQKLNFKLDNSVDLAVEGGLGGDYEEGTIAHKYYEASHLPSEQELAQDLEGVLAAYDSFVNQKSKTVELKPKSVSFIDAEAIGEIKASLERRGIQLPDALVLALLTGLKCQPITLLAGPTGTGKTQLALTLHDTSLFRVNVAEVEGGWTDSASAFGYVSPATQDFVPGPILLKLLDVLRQDKGQPLLVLDEINVSPPHVYLAPLLSTIERAFSEGKTVPLLVAQSGLSEESKQALQEAERAHPGLRVETSGPFLQLVLDIPSNLRIIGTLNFDASTEDLAPKVLSRSFVVWFEPPSVDNRLRLKPQSSYLIDRVPNPSRIFAETAELLIAKNLLVSARSIRRAREALEAAGKEADRLTDILLSGLILPQFQTLTAESHLGILDDALVDSLAKGYFRTRIEKMRSQLRTEGLANLWLIA